MRVLIVRMTFSLDMFSVFSWEIVQLTCNDVNSNRSTRLKEVFSQTIPKTTLQKHVKIVKGDGCLFGTHDAGRYDRV